MRTQRFSIFINVGGVSHSRIWDSPKLNEPLDLGYQLPWKIVRSEGEVRLLHKSGSIFPLPVEVLKEGTEIELKEPENDSGVNVCLKVTELPGFDPVFAEIDAGSSAADSEWQVFAYSGDWILDAQPVRGKYTGHRAYDAAFTLTEKQGWFLLKIKDPTVQITGIASTEFKSEGVDHYRVEPDQLARLNLMTETLQWRFVRVDRSAATKIVMLPQGPDAETLWFRRNLRNVAGAFLLLLLISAVLPKPQEEEKKEEQQFARIELPKNFGQQKKMIENMPAAPAAAGGGEQAEVVAENAKAAPAVSDQETDRKVNVPKTENAAKTLAATDPAKAKQTSLEKMTANSRANGQAAPGTPAPAKPKVSAAVLAAQKLQNSLGDLAGAGASALLAKSDRLAGGGGRRAGGGAVFGGGGTTDGTRGAALPTGGFSEGGQQNLKVAYTGSGGSADGRGVSSYGAGAPNGSMGIKGGSGNFVSVQLSQDEVGMAEEGLTKKEVWEVINKHLSEIRYCYERSIIRRPDIEGKLVVNFMIGKTGTVKTTAVKASTLEDSTLDSCVTTRLVTWRFPKPRGNIDVGVLYPFIFKRL